GRQEDRCIFTGLGVTSPRLYGLDNSGRFGVRESFGLIQVGTGKHPDRRPRVANTDSDEACNLRHGVKCRLENCDSRPKKPPEAGSKPPDQVVSVLLQNRGRIREKGGIYLRGACLCRWRDGAAPEIASCQLETKKHENTGFGSSPQLLRLGWPCSPR